MTRLVVLILALTVCVAVASPSPSLSASSGWMSPLANRTLRHVTLPGTHDSGAYNLTQRLQPGDSEGPTVDELIKLAEKLGIPIEDVITPWGRAQDHNLFGQLSGGIRYIDFRAGWNGTAWNTFHFEQGNPCHVLLQDIRRWLDASPPSEVIVVEVSHTGGGTPVAAQNVLAEMIVEIIGDYLLEVVSPLPTIGHMSSTGKRAVFTLDASAQSNYTQLWPADFILNSYADSDKLQTMVSYNDGKVKEFQTYTSPDLYKISWTLTPAADCILESVLPGHPKTLIELADTAVSTLVPWSTKYTGAGQPLANIVIIDHFESSDIVKVCLTSSLLKFPGN